MYKFGHWLCRILFDTLWRLKIIGQENIPERGGAIIASNHISFFDPPLIGSAIKREIHYLAKEELFRYPILGWIIKQVNVHPLRRGKQDIRAFKTALHLLQQGQMLLVFPEGTRSLTGELQKAKPGAAMLAVRAQVPIVPTFVWNTQQARRFRQFVVIFGKPIFPPSEISKKEDYQIISEGIMEAIVRLKKEYLDDRRKN